MFIKVADQGLGLTLPTELQNFLADVRARLAVAGGDGRINQIETEADSTLATLRTNVKFDQEHLDVADRLLRAAISRKRSERDFDE